MSSLDQNIIKFISDHNLISNNDKLLVALSGGADSVFSLLFFNKFKQKYNIQICALHINHSLRGSESDEDEKFCRKLTGELNIEYYSEKVDVAAHAKNDKLSIEEVARNIRYEMLKKYFIISNSNKIVTAHNLDDNTETVLLNLFRGTGLKGLAGIPIRRDNIIRPLLSVCKSDIIEYLNENKIEFRVDSTNVKNDFRRNYLRNKIIPKIKKHINKGVDNNISKISIIAKNSDIIINDLATTAISKFVKYSENEIIVSKEIKTAVPKLFGEVIKQSIMDKFSVSSEFVDIKRIEDLTELQVGSKVDLSNNLESICEREYLVIRQKDFNKKEVSEVKLYFNSEINFDNRKIGCREVDLGNVEISNSTDIEFIDAGQLVEPLVIRRWKENDRFKPLGLIGSKKISDFLTDQKIPNLQRKAQLVLLSNSKICWVVGYRIGENVKISNNTKRVIKLWVK